MCESGEGGCFPNSLFCDTNEDCSDGSDEINCGLYIYLNVPVTMGVAAITMTLLFILNEAIKLYIRRRTEPITIPISASPAVLQLPHLEEIESSFFQILCHPVFEKIFFNENKVYFLQFLDVMRLHNLGPQQRHKLLQSLLYHLKKTYGFPDDDTVFIFLREKFGACSSMRILLDSRSPPGGLENLKHTLLLKVMNFPPVLMTLANFWQTGINIGLLLWDFIKDVAFYFVLSNVFWNGGGEKSPMEAAIIQIILVSFLTSQLISGLYSFYRRPTWLCVQWKARWERVLFNIFLLAISPILPYLKMLKVSELRNKLAQLESRFVKREAGLVPTLNQMTEIQKELEGLEDEVTDICVIDACLESIINCSCLVSLVVFYKLNFYTVRGRYSYFDNLAVTLLSRGNWSDTFFFLGGILTSTLAASGKFVLYLNWCKHGAFSMRQKIFFVLFFFLAILARVLSLVICIHLSSWNFNYWLQTVEYQDKAERTGLLSEVHFRKEFLTYRPKQFLMLEQSMVRNITITIIFYSIHLGLTLLHSHFFIPSFQKASIKNRLVNLLANVFVPLPYCNSYETSSGQSFLMGTVHALENLLLFYICLLASPDDEVNRIKVNQLILMLLMAVPNISSLSFLLLYDRFLSNWAFINNSTWMKSLIPKTLPRYEGNHFN